MRRWHAHGHTTLYRAPLKAEAMKPQARALPTLPIPSLPCCPQNTARTWVIQLEQKKTIWHHCQLIIFNSNITKWCSAQGRLGFVLLSKSSPHYFLQCWVLLLPWGLLVLRLTLTVQQPPKRLGVKFRGCTLALATNMLSDLWTNHPSKWLWMVIIFLEYF